MVRSFTEVWTTLEVIEAPSVPCTYFWALQATFHDGRQAHGAAHLGLQWYPQHPDPRVVNWGGYLPTGAVMTGSTSPLPSATNDPNTRDYPWEPGAAYRLRIARSPGGSFGWRGEVTDLASGRVTVVRDLIARGDRLVYPIVWTEVFAPCDAPTVRVRWSELGGRTEDGTPVGIESVDANYQSHADGGCPNTTSAPSDDGRGILQETNTVRRVRQGARLTTR